MGRPLSEYVGESWPAVQRGLDRALAGLEHFEEQAYGDGQLVRRVLEVTYLPMRDGGDVIGVAVFARDVTTQRQAEDALRESEAQLRQALKMEAVGRLAGGVAHDFNNLLTVVLNSVHLALGPDRPDAARLELLHDVRSAAERAAELTRQLLTFSRKQVLRPTRLDLNEVLRELARLLRRGLGAHVTLELELAPALPPVLADRGQLEQVFVNLAVNARDAMPNGGVLTLRTSTARLADGEHLEPAPPAEATHVVVAVADEGTGISDGARARLFEPFFTTKPAGQGTGLGLATAYGVVRQSGGTIRVDTTLGRGSTFTVALPAAPGPRAAAGPSSLDMPAVRAGERVLVVDDDEAVRRVTTNVLTALGYDAHAVDGYSAALAMVEQSARPFDALVTDVLLRGADGFAVEAAVSAHSPTTRTLFMSGFVDDAIGRLSGTELGERFLHKPFTPMALAIAMRRLLDGRTEPTT